jgi:beta-glucanase (GH16 family)
MMQSQEPDISMEAEESAGGERKEQTTVCPDDEESGDEELSTEPQDVPLTTPHELDQQVSDEIQVSRASKPPQEEQTPNEGTPDLPAMAQVSSEYPNPVRAGEELGPASSALQGPADSPIRQRLQRKTNAHLQMDYTTQNKSRSQWSVSPLKVHDLGLDYSRYYDPFTDSARNSLVGRKSSASSLLSRSHAHTSGIASEKRNTLTEPSGSDIRLAEDRSTEETIFLIDDRLGAPYDEKDGFTWPLWGDEAEEDDAMHLPHPDDDKLFQLKWTEYFSRENIVPTIGVTFMLLGLFIIFIGLPVLVFTGVIDYTAWYETPLDQLPSHPPKEEWAWVNDVHYPLLNHIRSGLIDPDSPEHAMQMLGEFGDEYELVFSDEFNDSNRTFYEGDDPYFFAPDIWYGATQDLEWYDPDAVTTRDGVLELRLDKFKNHGLEFRSGMLNSWNQLCFKGGIFEVSVSLPGPAGVHGLWPGVWTLGNLGRPGYTSTTDGTWPYTYQACDVGITPNQSSTDGISWLPGMRLPSCTCPGEDHPSPGTGRGAPEIDIAEMSVSYDEKKLPVATQSYQVAPFDIWYYPNYEFTSFPDQRLSYTNTYTGGPFQQAISATTNLNRNWYDGKAYQRFSFEYVPGDKEGSHITWKIGGQTMFHLDGRALGPNGNIQTRPISQEPMSLVLNLGISNSWTWINWEELVFPTVLQVDYVRWYQKKGEEMVTCDPPGFETTQYISEHIRAYTNPNFTVSTY